jgi:hypothetical protein
MKALVFHMKLRDVVLTCLTLTIVSIGMKCLADEASAIGSTPGVSEKIAASEKTVATRDELVAALRDAKPGDVIRVAADATKLPIFEGGCEACTSRGRRFWKSTACICETPR